LEEFMAKKRDLYEILQVSRTASADEIKRSYRRLARKFHPDINPGNKQAEESFKELSAAYDVLSDPERRKLYDEFGDDALRQGFNPEQARAYQQWSSGRQATGGGAPWGDDLFSRFRGSSAGEGSLNFDDLFGDLLRGRGGRGRPAPQSGADTEAAIDVELLEAIHGVERTLVLGTPAGEQKSVRVRIPAGAEDGARVRVPGQGGPGIMGGPPGDLYLRVHVKPHPLLKRSGDALELELPITAGEAYRGAKIQVPTPDGNVTLTIPPHSQSGRRLRLKGRGAARKGGARGDLFVILMIHLPESDDPKVQEAIAALDQAHSTDVRANLRL
jgi:DnaJ-class molecular chaperone